MLSFHSIRSVSLRLNASFWQKIDLEVNFAKELHAYKIAMAKAKIDCEPFSNLSEDDYRMQILKIPRRHFEGGQSNLTMEQHCYLRLLDSPGFVKVFKNHAGIQDLE